VVDAARELNKIAQQGNLRRLPGIDRPCPGRIEAPGLERALIDFSSNDYLALSCHPRVVQAAAEALDRYGSGGTAARLMSGETRLHRQLEADLAGLCGTEAALLFGSGYLANIGVIPQLVGRKGRVFTDRLDHASIYDGARLASARLVRFRHNDLDHLEELLKRHGTAENLVVVESVYSMDGDFAPLADLIGLKERYGFTLMVDEAHGIGVFGDHGGGRVEELGVRQGVDLVMGTLGKALGGYGAFVAARQPIVDLLVNRARSFIFSTSLPPATVAAARCALAIARDGGDLRKTLHAKATFFKEALHREAGFECPSPSQIIPVTVGESKQAVRLSLSMREQGFYVHPVRPPTVPEGSARLRFTVTLHHSDDDLLAAARGVARALDLLKGS